MTPYSLHLNQLVSGIAIATSQYQQGRPAIDIVAGLHPFLPSLEADLHLAPVMEPLRQLASTPNVQPQVMAGAFHEAARQLARLTQKSHPPVSLWAEDVRRTWNLALSPRETAAAPAIDVRQDEDELIEWLRRFIEHSPEPMGVVKCHEDGSADMVMFNRLNRGRWGLGEADLVGFSVEHFFYPEDHDMLHDFIKECLRTGSSTRTGVRMLRRSGGHYLVDMYVGRVQDTKYAYFQVINETQREEALEQVRIREAVFRNAEMPLLMLSFDEGGTPSGMVTSAGFHKLLGYEPGEIGGKPVIDFIPRHLRTQFAARLRQFLAAGSLQWKAVELVRKDGSTVLVDIEANDSGVKGARFAIASFSDANARIAAERDAAEAQKLDTIARVTAAIAHDGNNIVTIIMGGLDLLQVKYPDDTFLPTMIEKVSMLTGMLNRFRMMTDTVEKEEGINLHSLLLESDIRLTAPRKDHVDIQFDLEEHPWNVAGPAFAIWQIVFNIIKNGLEAMERVPVRSLKLRTQNIVIRDEPTLRRLDPEKQFPDAGPGDFFRLSIEDTGGGIPAEILPRIFEDYFSTKDNSDVNRGRGLYAAQLAISKRRGLLVVETEVGKGTTFDIYLPRMESRSSLPPQPAGTSSSILPDERWVSRGNEVVLIADDDEGVRNQFQRILQFYRYTGIVLAGTADEVLEIARTRPELSAIVMDWRMPGMTGDELLHELQALNPRLPILVNTGLVPEQRHPYHNVQYVQKMTGAMKIGRALRLLIEGKGIK